MRVIALLALLVGFPSQLILNGQVYSQAILGVVCGTTAVVCGLLAARYDPARQWSGRTLAGLGAVLAVTCLVTMPSAYRQQQRFNEQIHKVRESRRVEAERLSTIVVRRSVGS